MVNQEQEGLFSFKPNLDFLSPTDDRELDDVRKGRSNSVFGDAQTDILKKDIKKQPIDIDRTNNFKRKTFAPSRSLEFSPTVVKGSPEADVTGSQITKKERQRIQPSTRLTQPTTVTPTQKTLTSKPTSEEQGSAFQLGSSLPTLLAVGGVGLGAFFLLSGDDNDEK